MSSPAEIGFELFGTVHDPQAVHELLRAHPQLDVDAFRDSEGHTALLEAAEDVGHPECVRQLLARGAAVEHQDKSGATALMVASGGIYTASVEALLEGGANVDARDEKGNTALMWAARSGPYESVAALLDGGADPNAKSNDGRTAAHFAAFHSHAESLDLLLDNGADVDDAQKDGLTALMYGALAGDQRIIMQVLHRNANPALRNAGGETALAMAKVKSEGTDATAMLRVCSRSTVGPLLDDAMEEEDDARIEDAIALARDAGVPVPELGDTRATARALQEGFEAWLTEEVGKDILAFIARPRLLRVLLEVHPDVDVDEPRSRTGLTALRLAAKDSKPESVRQLLERGAGVDTEDRKGWTPLVSACKGGSVECVRALVDGGADLNHATENGWTALMMACRHNHVGVVNVLLSTGRCDLSLTNSDGWTALHLSALERVSDLKPLACGDLLDAGADVSAVTNLGETPLSLARSCKNMRVAMLIVQRMETELGPILQASLAVNDPARLYRAVSMARELGYDIPPHLDDVAAAQTILARLPAASDKVSSLTEETKELPRQRSGGRSVRSFRRRSSSKSPSVSPVSRVTSVDSDELSFEARNREESASSRIAGWLQGLGVGTNAMGCAVLMVSKLGVQNPQDLAILFALRRFNPLNPSGGYLDSPADRQRVQEALQALQGSEPEAHMAQRLASVTKGFPPRKPHNKPEEHLILWLQDVGVLRGLTAMATFFAEVHDAKEPREVAARVKNGDFNVDEVPGVSTIMDLEKLRKAIDLPATDQPAECGRNKCSVS